MAAQVPYRGFLRVIALFVAETYPLFSLCRIVRGFS